MKIKTAICHSGNLAKIIRNPVKTIAYWIPACAGMTEFALDKRYAVPARRLAQASRI